MNLSKEILKDMFNSQFNLNTNTNGAKWIFGETKLDKDINWARTVYMETAELIDSYPWKHWKAVGAEADMLNVKIELTDLWHFIMSATIEFAFNEYFKQVHIKNKIVVTKDFISDNEIIDLWHNYISESCVDYVMQIFANEDKMGLAKAAIANKVASTPKEINKIIAPFEELMLQSLILSGLHANDPKADQRINFIVSLNSTFYVLLNEYVPFDLESVYKGKSLLNQFRQDHGYKEGTYKKMWTNEVGDKVEDNVVMFDLIVNNSISTENLYSELEKSYSRS